MKKLTCLWQLSGFLFACIVGTLLHFVYDWSGQSVVGAVFSSVNESTWEHMKILFIPMFAFAVIQKHLQRNVPSNFWCVKLSGILRGIFTIPLLFYMWNGIVGTSPAWLNIAFFYVSAFVAYYYECGEMKKEKKCLSGTMSFSVLCVIALAFLVFTFFVPPLEIFRDPVTNVLGI